MQTTSTKKNKWPRPTGRLWLFIHRCYMIF